MNNFKDIYENYINKTGNFGKISFIIDVVLCVLMILALCFYLFKRSKNKTVFIGLGIYVILTIVSIILGLQYVKILIIVSLPVAVICFFNYQILRIKQNDATANEHISKNNNGNDLVVTKDYIVDQIMHAVIDFKRNKTGALITIERSNSLNDYINRSVKLDALVSFELLSTIFYEGTKLHDGAVIIRNGKVACACAYYNPSDATDIASEYGGRHRAALGVAEETDAFSIIVSEQHGFISITEHSQITFNIDEKTLREKLNAVIEGK